MDCYKKGTSSVKTMEIKQLFSSKKHQVDQQTFTCSKPTIETLEKGAKQVQN